MARESNDRGVEWAGKRVKCLHLRVSAEQSLKMQHIILWFCAKQMMNYTALAFQVHRTF